MGRGCAPGGALAGAVGAGPGGCMQGGEERGGRERCWGPGQLGPLCSSAVGRDDAVGWLGCCMAGWGGAVTM